MITKKIKLYPQQHDFFVCKDRFAAFVGGIASGKTYVGSLWGIHQSKPDTLGLVIAPTYPMLRDVTWRTFKQLLGNLYEEKKAEMTLRVIGGGEVLFRSADDPDKLRGPNAHWALIDEMALCPEQTWDITIGRLRAGGIAGPCRGVTTPKGRNWLYKRQDEMTIFKSRTMDNPYLDNDFVTSLERAYTGDFKRQELGGEFVAFEGLVYPQFSREIHVVKRIPAEFSYFLMGNDEGYTNPAVILLFGIDNDNRVHIYSEWYRRGQLQDVVVAQNKVMYNSLGSSARPRAIIVDKSAAGLIAALNDERLPAIGSEGRVLDGIALVQNALVVAGDGRPRLTIDPSCVNAIAEFESYSWREGRDEPVKEGDHAMDVVRYVVQSISEIPGHLPPQDGARSLWTGGEHEAGWATKY